VKHPAQWQLLNSALFDSLESQARSHPRLRINYNLHQNLDEPVHRFLNVLIRGTYITPHRHIDPPKFESFLVLRGTLLFFFFDDTGSITDILLAGDSAGAYGTVTGVDIQPGVWHTLLPVSESAVCFEVKPGPYRESSDKDFALWAPREHRAALQEIVAYQETLMQAARDFGICQKEIGF